MGQTTMITSAEKINASISSTKKIIEERDSSSLMALAEKQAAANPTYIDINVGTGVGSRQDEIEAMCWAVSTVQEKIDVPLCIDSADPAVLEAGLTARAGRTALINSTKATEKNLAEVIPLAKQFGMPLVGLAIDEHGIPASADGRLNACKKIVFHCEQLGVPRRDIFFDPLVVPVSTDINQGRVALDSLARLKQLFPEAKTVMAVSNISFGLPQRKLLNSAFLHMALGFGLDGAICNVLDEELIGAIRTAEALLGKDRHCRRYTRYFRKR
jgi:cobalamin-dependent methionine synthase I